VLGLESKLLRHLVLCARLLGAGLPVLSQAHVVLVLQEAFLQSNEFKAVLESMAVMLRNLKAGFTDIPRDTRAIVVEGTPGDHPSPPLLELESEYLDDLDFALPPDHVPRGTQVIVDMSAFSGFSGVSHKVIPVRQADSCWVQHRIAGGNVPYFHPAREGVCL
jgi:hypothetical protein